MRRTLLSASYNCYTLLSTHLNELSTMVIGPFLLPPPVFSFLVGLIVLMILGGLLKKFIHPRFDSWTGLLTVAAFIAARLGFVFRHWESYRHNPLRILYIWQGGFDVSWAIIAAVLTVFFLNTWRHRAIAVGVLVITSAAIVLTMHMTEKTGAQDLPDIQLKALTNDLVNLSTHSDELVVINLWATWCGPCRREMPALERAMIDYPDIKFYFINQGESERLVLEFLSDEKLSLADEILMDPYFQISEYYQTLGTPVTLFFNNNRLKALHVGEISTELLTDRLKQFRL